ncbi:MAG: FtsX-like permease family protein, partial [Opitutaceae bacterium]
KLAIAQLKLQYPERPDSDRYEANATTVHEWVAGSLKRPLLFLWISAGLVLAIVGFNLGGLLLARGLSRRKELALRCALGAARGRVVRQLLMECLTLVATGSVLGGLLAWGFIHFLSVNSSAEIPLLQTLRLDEATLGFTVLLCVVTAVLCGAAPAWKLTRGMDLQNSLNEAGRNSTGGGQRSLTRNTLVILQVALACVLAVSAGLMVRSLLNLLKTDLGFQPRDLIAVRIDPVIQGSQANYLESVLDRVRVVPGVEHAAMTDCVPVERDRCWGIGTINPDKPKEQRGSWGHVRVISPGFFATMDTTLFAGRDFTLMDGTDKPRVLIINRTLAKWLWPTGESPIGHQVWLSFQDKPFTVIGVVGDVRHSGPEFPSGGEMYLSTQQEISYSWDMLVRTKLPVATLTADLRNALHDVDATLPLTKVRKVQTLVDRTLSSRRLLGSLIGGFAAIAIVLAALGLYGVIAYMVSQQKKEIGIRLALGASPATIQWRIVQQTMRLASCGLILGVGGTIAAGRLLQSLLYGVSANDGITYVVALGTVLACTVVAGYIPARRASRIDLIIALRAE